MWVDREREGSQVVQKEGRRQGQGRREQSSAANENKILCPKI